MSSVSSQCLAVVTVTPILSLVKTLVKRNISNFFEIFLRVVSIIIIRAIKK